MFVEESPVQTSVSEEDEVDEILKARVEKRFVLNWVRFVSFMAVWRERRKWGMMAGTEGVGLVRYRHLTHKESIVAAFGKLKLNMQTLWLRHLIVLGIFWIYPHQPLILTGEQSVLCQKLLITLFHRKAHFVAVPGDSTGRAFRFYNLRIGPY